MTQDSQDLVRIDETEQSPRPENDITILSAPIASASGWMKFLAVLTCIGMVVGTVRGLRDALLRSDGRWGAVVIVTLFVCIAFGIYAIWLAVLLFRSGNSAKAAAQSGKRSDLLRSLESIRSYFAIVGGMIFVFWILMMLIFLALTLMASAGVRL